MKLKFFGAARTVTGSRTLLEYKESRFLIDCGLFQGAKALRLKNWQTPDWGGEIDAVLLTHAHIDHSGFLPKLVKDGFKGPIYCSRATAELCKIMLLDAAHLQEEDARFANEKKYSSHDPCLPLFDTSDALRAIELLRPCTVDTWNDLVPGLRFRLIRSGHILGSTFVQLHYFEQAQDRIITFSGDLGNGRSNIIKNPTPILQTDYLILESTYGDRIQSHANSLDELGIIINRVFDREGTLIIPAFAVGRTQEILYLIKQLEVSGKIPKIPIYIDSPMAKGVTEVYLKFPAELKFLVGKNGLEPPYSLSDYQAVKSADESMMLCMSNEPKIVISAAGMLTGGRVMHHLKAKLPYSRNAVLFVGYQPEGTKGRLLKNGLSTIRIHHQTIHVEAEVLAIDSLSAHADSDDLVGWLKQIKIMPRTIFLNHGESSALEALNYRIKNELKWSSIIVDEGQTVVLD